MDSSLQVFNKLLTRHSDLVDIYSLTTNKDIEQKIHNIYAWVNEILLDPLRKKISNEHYIFKNVQNTINNIFDYSSQQIKQKNLTNNLVILNNVETIEVLKPYLEILETALDAKYYSEIELIQKLKTCASHNL